MAGPAALMTLQTMVPVFVPCCDLHACRMSFKTATLLVHWLLSALFTCNWLSPVQANRAPNSVVVGVEVGVDVMVVVRVLVGLVVREDV